MFSSAQCAGQCGRRPCTRKRASWRCVVTALFAVAAAGTAVTASATDWQMRENVLGSLRFSLRTYAGALGARKLTLFTATRSLTNVSAAQFRLATRSLNHGMIPWTIDTGGGALAPEVFSSDTPYPDFWRAEASYWRQLFAFEDGGALWVSAGLTYVLIDSRVNTGFTPGGGEDRAAKGFRTRVLPVPSIGIHLGYPLTDRLSLDIGIEGGHLPWTNTLRRDGGVVQFSQTNADADLGLRYRFSNDWVIRLYWYAFDYQQRERSEELDSYLRLSRYGLGFGISKRF